MSAPHTLSSGHFRRFNFQSRPAAARAAEEAREFEARGGELERSVNDAGRWRRRKPGPAARGGRRKSPFGNRARAVKLLNPLADLLSNGGAYMADEPIVRAIKELRTELSRLDQVIKSIELLVAGKPRRGRPPKFLQQMENDGTAPKKRRRPLKRPAVSE